MVFCAGLLCKNDEYVRLSKDRICQSPSPQLSRKGVLETRNLKVGFGVSAMLSITKMWT